MGTETAALGGDPRNGDPLATPSPPERPERASVPRRIFRWFVGLIGAAVLALLVMNWVVTPLVLPKTSDAWMNAPLTTIRAESEGDIHIAREVGDVVAIGSLLANTVNAYLNPASVWQLKTEQANLEAELTRATRESELANNLKATSSLELDKYRRALTADLVLALRQADAKIAELTVLLNQSERIVKMTEPLSRIGAVTADDSSRALENETIAQHRLDQGSAEKDSIANQLEAIKTNVYIQRDSPIYLLWYLETQQSVPVAQAKVEETKRRLASVQLELAQADAYVRRLAGGAILSPVAGLVWRRNASSGPVAKGESILEIAEAPAREFIEAQFQESRSTSLYPGARAIVQFSGLQPLAGEVRAVRQPSPTDLDNAYAIRLPRRINQLKVYIHVLGPPQGVALVGRQCKVLIADPAAHPLAGFAWVAVRVFLWIRF